ncbi:MAG: (2Fe-2S)-binding protein, partial [Roseobacter sp.]
MVDVKIVVNGVERSGSCEGRTLLSGFLREELGLTGTHVG